MPWRELSVGAWRRGGATGDARGPGLGRAVCCTHLEPGRRDSSSSPGMCLPPRAAPCFSHPQCISQAETDVRALWKQLNFLCEQRRWLGATKSPANLHPYQIPVPTLWNTLLCAWLPRVAWLLSLLCVPRLALCPPASPLTPFLLRGLLGHPQWVFCVGHSGGKAGGKALGEVLLCWEKKGICWKSRQRMRKAVLERLMAA